MHDIYPLTDQNNLSFLLERWKYKNLFPKLSPREIKTVIELHTSQGYIKPFFYDDGKRADIRYINFADMSGDETSVGLNLEGQECNVKYIATDKILFSKSDIDTIENDKMGNIESVPTEIKSKILDQVIPERINTWFEAMDHEIKLFEKEYNITPTCNQLWSTLINNPARQYNVSYNKKKKYLEIDGEKPLDKENFTKRYNRIYPKQTTNNIPPLTAISRK